MIHLEFDERIQLDRVRDKLLISPPLASLPVVKINGPRGVDISWEEELQPNTTYTFNLGGAVKDLTEGNAAAGINYVFSTGDALDGLVILAGSVANAFSGAAEKDMLVLLYNAGDTATFRTSRPAYMTRCNGEGAFTITNLPARKRSMRSPCAIRMATTATICRTKDKTYRQRRYAGTDGYCCSHAPFQDLPPEQPDTKCAQREMNRMAPCK